MNEKNMTALVSAFARVYHVRNNDFPIYSDGIDGGILYEEEYYKKPVAKFRTLTKSLKYYEILDDIELVLHVRADEDVLNDIYENIYNLQALGRSEDFVHVEEAVMVELVQRQENVRSPFSAYLNYYDVVNNNISIRAVSGKGISGTRYYL